MIKPITCAAILVVSLNLFLSHVQAAEKQPARPPKARLTEGQNKIAALKVVTGLDGKTLPPDQQKKAARLDNLFAALEMVDAQAPNTNDSLRIFLSKKKGESGVDYNSALGLVTSAAEGAYEDTGKTIDLEGLRTLLRQSSEAGHTARAQVNVALDKKGQPWQVFLMAVHVQESSPKNPLLAEIGKRQNLHPPMILSLYIHDATQMYVAAFPPK